MQTDSDEVGQRVCTLGVLLKGLLQRLFRLIKAPHAHVGQGAAIEQAHLQQARGHHDEVPAPCMV